MQAVADKVVGGFRILSELKSGAGAQGTVCRAVCETDDFPRCPRGTIVALKTMSANVDSERRFEKLKARTEALMAIECPNIVKYFGCFCDSSGFSEIHVVIEELLEGETLKQRLEANPGGLDSEEALRVVRGMLAGLVAASENGIVHRDIKPANVFLCNDGCVKLIDFETASEGDAVVSTSNSSGSMVGTYVYMAPDFTDPHFAGDERSDIFSAGAVMHEALTGKLPYSRFTGAGKQMSFAYLDRWAKDDKGVFLKGSCQIAPSVDRTLAHAKSVLTMALALRRDRRFASFAEFASGVERIRFRELRNGDRVYRILKLIGKGGFGEVFKARSEGRTLAVKHLLKSDYAARFYREAKIMSELNDSCFVRFFDFFVLDHAGAKEAFLVMDFLPGMPGNSLRDAIRKSAGIGIDFTTVMKAFVRYAHGLRVIHERGIYHRDIKPTNLYFPEDRPDAAAIMDLGIARDESGTETTGQVPGTLDYMPPETALGGTRGDAGMDIYALGLCLYEALTGKKGFPRLPSGNAAFAQFFQRAKEKARPNFDDELVKGNPKLLKLLEEMTEPEAAWRLSDTAELERRMEELLSGAEEMNVSDDSCTVTLSRMAARPLPPKSEVIGTPENSEDDEATGETAFVPVQSVAAGAAKAIDDGLRKYGLAKKLRTPTRKALLVAGAIGAMLLSGVLFICYDSAISSWVGRNRSHRLEEGVPGSGAAGGLFADLVDFYGDEGSPIEKIDETRDRWLASRKGSMSESDYERLVGILEAKREQRIIRDRISAERSRLDQEAKGVVVAYGTLSVKIGDERREKWRADWKSAPKAKQLECERMFDAARAERESVDAARALVPEASEAAERIARSYTESGVRVADRELDAWKNEWRVRLLHDDYERILKTVSSARDLVMRKVAENERQSAGKALVNECQTLVASIQPVATRSSRLQDAKTKLRAGCESGLIDRQTRESLEREIETLSTWTVFEIVNRSDLELNIDGIALKSGESHVFVYTNAPPADLSASCKGYESLPLGEQTGGRSLTLLPEHFTMHKVSVDTGVIEEGVLCRVDGVSVKNGTIRLLPGSHECIYSRNDCRNQVIPFRLEPGTDGKLPPPGKWSPSEDKLRREQESKRAERIKEIEKHCELLMRPEPIANRAERLQRCARLLRNMRTPEILGAERCKELVDLLAKAETRNYGAVVNESSHELKAEIDGATLVFPPKERVLVEFAATDVFSATLKADGYEEIALPKTFAGMDFKVTEEAFRVKSVEVTVPELEEEVICQIDGNPVKDKILLAPGRHKAVFRRPDYSNLYRDFTVQIGKPMTLEKPYGWSASPALQSLIAAESAAERGDWNRVRSHLAAADVSGSNALRRKTLLSNRMQRRKQYLAQLDAADSAYINQDWQKFLSIHYALRLDGYMQTSEDLKRLKKAAKAVKDMLDVRRRIIGNDDRRAVMSGLSDDERRFETMIKVLELGAL